MSTKTNQNQDQLAAGVALANQLTTKGYAAFQDQPVGPAVIANYENTGREGDFVWEHTNSNGEAYRKSWLITQAFQGLQGIKGMKYMLFMTPVNTTEEGLENIMKAYHKAGKKLIRVRSHQPIIDESYREYLESQSPEIQLEKINSIAKKQLVVNPNTGDPVLKDQKVVYQHVTFGDEDVFISNQEVLTPEIKVMKERAILNMGNKEQS